MGTWVPTIGGNYWRVGNWKSGRTERVKITKENIKKVKRDAYYFNLFPSREIAEKDVEEMHRLVPQLFKTK